MKVAVLGPPKRGRSRSAGGTVRDSGLEQLAIVDTPDPRPALPGRIIGEEVEKCCCVCGPRRSIPAIDVGGGADVASDGVTAVAADHLLMVLGRCNPKQKLR